VPDERVAISGSEVKPSGVLRRLQTADPAEAVEATIVIRRPAAANQVAAELLAGRASQTSREQMQKQLAADPADMKTVTEYARLHGLNVLEESAEKRMVRVAGTLRQMNAAFGIELGYVAGPGGSRFLSYNGPLTAPARVSAAITAVLGLHREPVARPRTAQP